MPQFVNEAVYFSKLLKSQKSGWPSARSHPWGKKSTSNPTSLFHSRSICQDLSGYPESERLENAQGVQKCPPQAGPHTEARYQPPASQKESASASKLSCSRGSKQLLKSKSLKLLSFMVRISLIRVFSRVTTCLVLNKVAPSGCFLSSSKFKQWLSFLFYSVSK